MIISHEHRFIFIKTQKTAGTSIEVLLSDLVEERAVVTPVKPAVPGHRPRNYATTGRAGTDIPAALRRGIRRVRRPASGGPDRPDVAFYNHIPASRVVELVGRRTWESYFTFTIERNPWDKVASAFFWQREGAADPEEFRRWVATRAPASERIYTVAESLPVDFPRYSLDGQRVGVDFVGRYEELETDLTSVLDTLGLVGTGLPRTKAGGRPSIPLDELYDEQTIERVALAFAAEVETFGFAFPT